MANEANPLAQIPALAAPIAGAAGQALAPLVGAAAGAVAPAVATATAPAVQQAAQQAGATAGKTAAKSAAEEASSWNVGQKLAAGAAIVAGALGLGWLLKGKKGRR